MKDLTSAQVRMPSLPVGRELAGSSPPSLFVGRAHYPHVNAGPMIATTHGDTAMMDMPEAWIPAGTTREEIIGFRLNLVRGMRRVDVRETGDRFITQLQEIALASGSVESDASFEKPPHGTTFTEEHTPFGPSGALDRLTIDPGRWDPALERAFHDTDLPAADAVVDLHEQGMAFSRIQKALSAGTFGRQRERRLVPTRWSITACDSMIADHLLNAVKTSPLIDSWRVHEFSSLSNRYAVILAPTPWKYEWIEAFHHVIGDEELIFADHEGHRPKRGYSPVGGCYYSCKMAVLEALSRMGFQAGAFILREANRGYVPLGVFNVRENVRHALMQPYAEYEDLRSALASLHGKFTLPIPRYIRESNLLRGELRERQASLTDFLLSTGSQVPCSPAKT